MSSLADAPNLVGFFSYSRDDDEDSGGRLSKLRERIQAELRGQLGRTKADFRLWQDKVAIADGELWEETIKKGISESVFFIPIITPTAIRSRYCKFEFESFLAREKELDRNNLIFPILYIPVPALTDERWRQDPLLSIIGSRQYEDWQNLRRLDASSSEAVALRVQTFCANICRALQQPWLSPEECQQAEAEAERRRQETITRFDTLRLAEAEKEKRERQRLELGGKSAAKEAQSQKALKQEPQQQVKPWLLPVIGAIVGCASPTLLVTIIYLGGFPYWGWKIGVPSITNALWGGAARMLVARLGILKSVAIPAIPAFLLTVLFYHGVVPSPDALELAFASAVYCAPSYLLMWFAFWLHSLWVRKDAGLIPP